jgi:hypothetical protein
VQSTSMWTSSLPSGPALSSSSELLFSAASSPCQTLKKENTNITSSLLLICL